MSASPVSHHVYTDPEIVPIHEDAGLGRSIAIGAIIGMFLAGIGVTAGMLASGLTSAESIGVGLMAAFWGGLGFGSMVGGVTFLSRNE